MVKTLILMCNQKLTPFLCSIMSVSWFAFFLCWVFCGATVFPAQKAESPASEPVTLLERWDTNQRQAGSHFRRLQVNSFFKVKSSILLGYKYYSFRFGISTIPNPFSTASNWVKIIIKFLSGNLGNEDYKQTAFDYYLRESIAVLAQAREQRHF